jgi:hypothetical protein
MTAAPFPASGFEVAPRAPARFDRYLIGAKADAFLFGPGATLLVAGTVLALQAMGRGGAAAANTLATWLALAFVGPHYGATYRRAYSSFAIVRAHPWVTLVAPPLLLAAALVAVRYPTSIGLLYFAAYVGWSGYHYAGQSLGLAMLYPLRQGARLDGIEKRLIAAPLYLSWILSLVGLFGVRGPVRNPAYDSVRVAYHGTPVPVWALLVGLGVVVASFACVAVVAIRRARRGTPLPWLTYAVLSAHVLWFTVGLFDPFFGVRLVPVFHGLQYLGFTSWHATNGRQGPARWRSLAFYAVPTLLLGLALYPGSFRVLSGGHTHADYIAAAAVASFMNLHHFLLDGRIWRMRERKVVESMVA